MVAILKDLVWGVVLSVVDAYAVWLLWGWHGVPLGLPAITIWRAMGVSSLWSIFALRVSAADTAMVVDAVDDPAAQARNERVDAWRKAFWFVFTGGIVFFGWIAKVLAE